MKIRHWFMELRAPFFTASIVPVILGSSIGWYVSGEFRWLYFVATLIGGLLLHAGANVSNDYFDFKNNSDNINREYIRPFSGGSRMIQNDLMKPKEVLAESLICYALALLIGIWLIHERGPVILWLGLIGAFSGFFYTAPPFRFVARGVGEIVIALNFGILMTLGSYFVQTGHLSWVPIVASIPVALLIAGVLYINEFPDYNADKESGKAHLVARWGRKKAATIYLILLIVTYLSVIFGVAFGAVSLIGLFALATIPLAIKAARAVLKHFDSPQKMVVANSATIQLHLFIGLILSASYIISAFTK